MTEVNSTSKEVSANTIRDECKRYALLSGYKDTDLPRGLETFAAHVFVLDEGFLDLCDGDDPETADLEDYICRQNDLGVDVVLPDEDGRRLLIAQCAHVNKGLPPEDKVKAFFDSLDPLCNPEYLASGSEQVQHLLGALPEQIKDGYEIILRFVTSAATGSSDRLKQIVVSANEKYSSRGFAVTCELLGRTETLRLRDELQSGMIGASVGEATFKLQDGRFFLIEESKAPNKTLIAQVKANELVDLYNRHGVGANLFNLNIRLPLASKKINPKIQETASDPTEAQNFFYYNNGISAVCAGFEMSGNEVVTRRLQVVNGAQTLSALVKAKKKLSSETFVLLRLTATDEKYGGSFTDNIIRYNNTQNPVKVAD